MQSADNLKKGVLVVIIDSHLKNLFLQLKHTKTKWFCTNSCYAIYANLIPANINSRQVALTFVCFQARLLSTMNVGPTLAQISTWDHPILYILTTLGTYHIYIYVWLMTGTSAYVSSGLAWFHASAASGASQHN